ncbi:uncharacterized protein LOC110433444 isoform X1 [Sorghum bicolor]|uniref:uncharacterized protein LOC110433444 isoform X1 n=1 Tax=Sorghum bicolor TaxID=4558 RepID=UPI000B426421|nr:uncharacterized protein LOC110433444 isoform X1 [Sorghum bicolor]|eukprot:XP_021311277.1 uncharacterized protein LOC110433444 isoform X1 [Sorghum bicolor]
MMPSAVWGAPCAGTGHVRALWRCLHAHHRGLKRRRRKHEIPSPIKTVVVVVMENHRKPVRAWDMSAHAYVDAVDLRRCRANSIVGQRRWKCMMFFGGNVDSTEQGHEELDAACLPEHEESKR